METVEFVIPELSGAAQRDDLGNTITGITGVAHVALNAETHTVTVEYDSVFVTPEMIRGSVDGSGYPIEQ